MWYWQSCRLVLSTAKVYQNLQWDKIQKHPDTKAMLEAITTHDVIKIGQLLGNVLEDVTISMVPKIVEIKQVLLQNGAAGALMSGSGPASLCIYRKRNRKKCGKNGQTEIWHKRRICNKNLSCITGKTGEEKTICQTQNLISIPMNIFH